MSLQGQPRRPQRQDTFDLRERVHSDDHHNLQAHADAAMNYGTDEEEHSVLDDSDQEDGEEFIEDDDMSSTLSIPNESIDFDMVYAFHSFAATVEGQANVVKGDSLYLMDDSNSYWWLVRVLKTQEVGYIPAENIETPFERLARLNKHRNVDLGLATEAEKNGSAARDQLRNPRAGPNHTPSPLPDRTGSRSQRTRSVHFTSVRSHYRYIPALREGEIEEEDDEWEVEGYEDEDLFLAADQMYLQSMEEDVGLDLDDGMEWDDIPTEDVQPGRMRNTPIPDALQPASLREQEQQRLLRAQQQQLQQQQQQELAAQQQAKQIQLQQQQQPTANQPPAAQQTANTQAQQAPQQASQQTLRASNSRERLAQDASQAPRRTDPAEVTETRKVTATPNIAREYEGRPAGQPYLPSVILEKHEEERAKRTLDDESSDEGGKKKPKSKEKMAPPVSSATYNKQQQQPSKLRKDPVKDKVDTDDESKDKKKKSSVFGGLFGRGKKEKGKDTKTSIGSMESNEYLGRSSEDSARSAQRPAVSDGTLSPTTTTAQQQQQQAINLRNVATDLHAPSQTESQPAPPPQTPERSIAQVSQHASQLRQRDQQQQALYQQYLNRSPSSPPEAQPSYGLQSASAVMLSSPSSNSALGPPTPRARPGSLILTSPSSNDPQANLSVIRVFAGKHLQTEATFKTVLLNPSTTASDLVRQAIQRFRLPSAEDEIDYYLTIKQVEGGAFAVLRPQEHPLGVFETLVVEATELPKVKRSSVGSISSVSSNLSMHPAIKKLSMNDFTDDSAVKFYLNRRVDGKADDSMNGHEGDDTLIADTSHGDSETHGSNASRPQYLSASTIGANVTPDRFSSPSIRFPLQLVIYSEDLPEDMQFHPETEAIVFKYSLPDPKQPVVVSPTLRGKIFMFPKNVTVAEVTELGLERFGIQDGVVDGGDEVEDKTTKRRSVVRVRYGLTVSQDGHERELSPSSKVTDAFTRPPIYRAPDRQAAMNKRRSLDSTQLLGSLEDVRKDDPVFILRRATSYRNSTSRRRISAPLDEYALKQFHQQRESTSSYNSDVPGPSRQEIIAAQRAKTRATQSAIVSAQTNSVRGLDVLLPGNAMLRSSRYDADNRMRYSYVEAGGETYDVSDIIEEEWREMNTGDLLEGVVIRNKDGIGEKLDRTLNKIRKGKGKQRGSSLSIETSDSAASPSEYSGDETEVFPRSTTPGTVPLGPRAPSAAESIVKSYSPFSNVADDRGSRSGTTTPTNMTRTAPTPTTRRNPSVTSVVSDYSGRGTPLLTLTRVPEEKPRNSPRNPQRLPIIPKDDFGISHMMAIIDYKASQPKKPTPPLDPVDELLFGAPLDLDSLHPQVRDIYAAGFKQLEEIDKVLDTYIAKSVVGTF